MGNCNNCEMLEYIEDDTSDGWPSPDSGFICHSRVYKNDLAEENHLEQLNSDAYRARTKKCFVGDMCGTTAKGDE